MLNLSDIMRTKLLLFGTSILDNRLIEQTKQGKKEKEESIILYYIANE